MENAVDDIVSLRLADPEFSYDIRVARSHLHVADEKPRVSGKFLVLGKEKVWVKGITYGTFRPNPEGYEYPPIEVVARDLRSIAQTGFNTLRTYTIPPRYLLDKAAENG